MPEEILDASKIGEPKKNALHPMPTNSRGIVFDRRNRKNYSLTKGLQKPGRVSYDVLRRASVSVHIARICINVLKEKVTKTDWVIKPIKYNAKVDPKKIEMATELFKHPNRNDETFRTLLDKMVEDLLVLDSVAVEKTRYRNGGLAELHYVDAASVRPVYDIHGNQDVYIPIGTVDGTKILPVSYVQLIDNSPYGGPESGEVVAAWPKKDFLFFHMHPTGQMDGFGYGLSPLESVLSVVSNLLNADNYNGTYFEEGSFPPLILQLMANLGQRELETAREYLYSELEGNFHRPAILAGNNKAEVINLKGSNNRDMEFMEYVKFLSRLLAAAYGLSGQDIGLTDDLNRATSEVQKDLSDAKGYGSVLHLLKEVFNQEILWKDFGFTDLEFEWIMPDSLQIKEAVEVYDKALRNGTYTLNEVRQKLGENPYEAWADTPMLLTGEGYSPLIKKEEEKTDEKEIDNPGGEKPYHEQEDLKKSEFKKSYYTSDGYNVFLDDRGHSQPFIYYNILTNEGFVIKPPVAVNLNSQELEIDLSGRIASLGGNVKGVSKMTDREVKNMFPSLEILAEFDKYQKMTYGYDSEKWKAKFGGSRLFPYYLVSQYIAGRNLRDVLLLADMQRDPDSYRTAVKELAKLWMIEKELVLGDRRADQYIITPDKHAYGIDYQFEGDEKRWKDTSAVLLDVLALIPSLKELFDVYVRDEKQVTKSAAKTFFQRLWKA